MEETEVLPDLMSRQWHRLGEAPREMHGGSSAVVAWDENRAIIITHGDSVTVYNKMTMETETLASKLIQARHCHASLVVGGNLFVIGGRSCGGRRESRMLDSIEVLDLNDPREFKLFPVSLEIARVNCAAVAVNEHEIYILGGVGEPIVNPTESSVEIVNISTKTISQGPRMMMNHLRVVAALVGDLIVVAGRDKYSEYGACEQLSTRISSDEQDRQWRRMDSMTEEKFSHHGLSFGDCMVVFGGFNTLVKRLGTTEVWNSTTGMWTKLPATLQVENDILGFVKLGNDLVCFEGGDSSSVYCLFSASGLLEHQRRQIRFNDLIADERSEIVIPLLLEGLGQRGWISLFYECIRESNGRLIPQRSRSALGKRHRTGV